ncbi:50S ribosomal protein L5 [Candidatus Mycosynbacter amalyticus]|uniref:Large ribosomal subunit protein uL5 n=1 Tax=Candidatus Mycosynbacter amalyticus TaxID=2665156 RepID=A0A857MTU2_9BACT|nr:50S ribosomal protein L5 [Candidatus Mycosynbacter amalyticus]QHN42827.1 50S ribosomal protein L5 [Candidatus Mycosynbacter amalyticus]
MAKATETAYTPRLKALYDTTVKKELQTELGLTNVHQVPKLEKIVVSVGLGKNKDDKRHYEVVKNTLTKITGQAPIDRMAKKSIAGFKIRAGMNRIGISVTLRGAQMYEFMDRFVNVAMPRIRDFHGVGAKAFDKGGNYNVGINDQSIFPELTFEETQVIHGLQVTFVIANEDKAHSRALLEKFGVPFEKEGGRR